MAVPELVEAYLERCVPAVAADARCVRLHQIGEMLKRPGGRPMRFSAVEDLAADRVAFGWDARFAIAPLVTLKVHDGYAAGAGALRASALGFPFMRQSGPSLHVGETIRYLAELPWVPQAIAANPELTWSEVDAHTVEVSTDVCGAPASVQIHFGRDGDVASVHADARPGEVEGHEVTAGWGGRFSAYRWLGGLRLPTRGDVYWDLPTHRFVYWRGQVTAVTLRAEAFAAPRARPAASRRSPVRRAA
jgi:hypothetical protein